MFILCDGHCVDALSSPSLQKVHQVLASQCGSQNVVCDSGNVSIEDFLNADAIVVVCDQSSHERDQLVQVNKEIIERRLAPPNESNVAGNLLGWMKQHGFLDQLGLFDWSHSLDEMMARLEATPIDHPRQAEFKLVLKSLMQDSFEFCQGRDLQQCNFKASLLWPAPVGKLPKNVHLLLDGDERFIPSIFAGRPYTLISDVVHDQAALLDRIGFLIQPPNQNTVKSALRQFFIRKNIAVEAGDPMRVSALKKNARGWVFSECPSDNVQLQIMPLVNEPQFCFRDNTYFRKRVLCGGSDDFYHFVITGRATEEYLPIDSSLWWTQLDVVVDSLLTNPKF